MKEINICPCCGSSSIKSIKTIRFDYPGKNVENNLHNISHVRKWIFFEKILKNRQPSSFKIMRCSNCGFLFLNPRITEKEMKIKYQTTNELGDVKARYSLNPAQNLDERALRVFKLIKKYFKGQLKNKKILDYGGSWGYNLYPFIEDNECFILDMEKWNNYKEKIKYLGRDFNDLKSNDPDSFNIILFQHTLEHIIEPYLVLKELNDYLQKNGIIYVEVPLGAFYEYSHLDDPITHLNFFSEESLVKLFNRVGLKVIHVQTKNQWITTSKGLCINIIGIKKGNKDNIRKINFKTTKYQMYNYFYFLPLIYNRLESKLKLEQ